MCGLNPHHISIFDYYSPIAQLVERAPVKRNVVGSSPTGRAKSNSEL